MPGGVPSNFDSLPPQMQQLVGVLADGMIKKFLEFFPTGIADPNFPIFVKRETQNGPITQQTTFAQLVAEQIDESKKHRAALNKLTEITAEALDETRPRSRRR